MKAYTKLSNIFSNNKASGISLKWNDKELKITHYTGNRTRYFCGKRLLETDKEKKLLYQVLLFDYKECCFAKIYTDHSFKIVFETKSNVPNKHGAGGQSAARFSRIRQEKIKHWFKKLNEKLTQIEGNIVIGTNEMYYNQFYNRLHQDNKEKITKKINTEYSDASGIYQLINKEKAKALN